MRFLKIFDKKVLRFPVLVKLVPLIPNLKKKKRIRLGGKTVMGYKESRGGRKSEFEKNIRNWSLSNKATTISICNP